MPFNPFHVSRRKKCGQKKSADYAYHIYVLSMTRLCSSIVRTTQLGPGLLRAQAATRLLYVAHAIRTRHIHTCPRYILRRTHMHAVKGCARAYMYGTCPKYTVVFVTCTSNNAASRCCALTYVLRYSSSSSTFKQNLRTYEKKVCKYSYAYAQERTYIVYIQRSKQ